jgi:hypothetical protein
LLARDPQAYLRASSDFFGFDECEQMRFQTACRAQSRLQVPVAPIAHYQSPEKLSDGFRVSQGARELLEDIDVLHRSFRLQPSFRQYRHPVKIKKGPRNRLGLPRANGFFEEGTYYGAFGGID